MPETILIDAQAGTLPEGFCPKGPGALQELYDQFIASTQWSLAVGIRFFNYGDTVPTADFRIYPWLKTVAGYPERWYVWSTTAGRWLWPHDIPPGPSGFRCGWVGTEDELKVYDGGEIAAVTLFTGPFWEIDHDFDGRSPMGPGLIPDANPAKTLSVGENYGKGAELGTPDNLPPHTHPFLGDPQILNGPNLKSVINGVGGAGVFIGLTGPPQPDISIGENTFTSSQEASPVIHPVRGRYEIKRTIRKYFRGT